jgi:hypothetical protein
MLTKVSKIMVTEEEPMEPRKVRQEATGKLLGQVRKGQETVTGAIRTAVSVAQFVTPPLPPAVASLLPDRDELASSAHQLAGRLQTVQHRAGEKLAEQRQAGEKLAGVAQRRATELAELAQRRAEELLAAQRRAGAALAESAQRRTEELSEVSQKRADGLVGGQLREGAARTGTAQRQAEKLLLAQRQWAAQAIEAVRPLLDRAGLPLVHPADVAAWITGRITPPPTSPALADPALEGSAPAALAAPEQAALPDGGSRTQISHGTMSNGVHDAEPGPDTETAGPETPARVKKQTTPMKGPAGNIPAVKAGSQAPEHVTAPSTDGGSTEMNQAGGRPRKGRAAAKSRAAGTAAGDTASAAGDSGQVTAASAGQAAGGRKTPRVSKKATAAGEPRTGKKTAGGESSGSGSGK